jgi:uncharacterized membrane protein YccF (DUF307 family)
MIRLILNILWFFSGGALNALHWYLMGVLMAVSVVGLPWSRACFTLGTFSLWPFGRQMVDRRLVTGEDDIGTGVLGSVGNILWFIFAGWHLALVHLGLALACALTIIGIPFAVQHFKLALASLMPIGMTVVECP